MGIKNTGDWGRSRVVVQPPGEAKADQIDPNLAEAVIDTAVSATRVAALIEPEDPVASEVARRDELLRSVDELGAEVDALGAWLIKQVHPNRGPKLRELLGSRNDAPPDNPAAAIAFHRERIAAVREKLFEGGGLS